ncbi:MAG: DNA gyrase/topoisomerase IV subunit A [Chitinophagales bacterium]|nr:DNA gyrase/topoisomerase IV subunit A [Bacteroidota bacterium]MCB9043237.1 DNA gyrase/topoisomerase IV subunit A [Chitinophagales bacterium]
MSEIEKPFSPNNIDTHITQEGEVLSISGLYQNWFLDYASYVILERAVPALQDGLKPVQRRILHAMFQMNDGRFHKVANIIGQTMQYHPHGDASIEDALVNLGQKDLLIDCQGNWGDPRTGDGAAAARYIEARLSKFALDVAFDPNITQWQLSYDGRKKEPINLPVKFPLLLFLGVEGIAVGLATKILPHNFIELIEGAIKILQGKNVLVYPDFPTGGLVDISNYNDGLKGGKVKVRAAIEELDKKTLVIKDLPYGTTTSQLIDSIIKANDKGKIKIKQIVDNTASEVEILVKLAPNVSPSLTLDALYAFTDCELSISPNACVIIDEKPHFIGVSEILRMSALHTKELLRLELEIKYKDLEEKWHFASLEKIFIENRIYRQIEECETWEAVIETIDTALNPFKPLFVREITRDDIVKLTEIKIKRISKYDAFKADEAIKKLEEEMRDTQHHLENINDFAIQYYKDILQKYGKGRERKTQIRSFDTIEIQQVAALNQKLYVDRKGGFIGWGLKKDEFVCDCSDMDDIIVFRKDCRFLVTRISEKAFVGKDIIHLAVWKKGDERTIYNMIYAAPEIGKNFAKRFAVTAITRDKEYDLFSGTKKPKLLYFTANPNGESEIVSVQLSQDSAARQKSFDFNFGELTIKGRQSQGNIISKYAIKKVQQKSLGESTLGGRKLWVDTVSGKINEDGRGQFLGSFDTGDQILVLYKDGNYELSDFELGKRFPMENVVEIVKYSPEMVINCVYYNGERKDYYVKRFHVETSTTDQKFLFISDAPRSNLVLATIEPQAVIEVSYTKDKSKTKESFALKISDFIEVKGWKVLGNKLCSYKVVSVKRIEDAPEQKNEPQVKENTPAQTPDAPVKLKRGDEISWEINAQPKLFEDADE